jgi:hypothetical protein
VTIPSRTTTQRLAAQTTIIFVNFLCLGGKFFIAHARKR